MFACKFEKALVLAHRLPDFAPRAPSVDALTGDASELAQDWGKHIGSFIQACALKCKSAEKTPERKYFGISLMQLPVSELEEDDLLSQPRGHSHFMAYVHWGSVGTNLGRRMYLDGDYIKYSQPINKRHFDMSRT